MKFRIEISVFLYLLFLTINSTYVFSKQIDTEQLIKYVSSYNYEAIKEMGPEVIPILTDLYSVSDVKQKRVIANTFYALGWKSDLAKSTLLQDVRTENKDLRISVQYALGRVSDDPEVVNVLLQNMQHDKNAYFRDKAACALAYDQIHLTDVQKVQLYEGLIKGLSSPNRQVRDIALKALKIHTGQTKGFKVNGTAINQADSIKKWYEWLEEYKNNL